MIFQHASELAIRAALYLAQQAPGKLTPVHEIAAHTEVSQAYLAKILGQLTSSRLVRSFRGPGKGVELAKAPNAISLADVIGAIEGPRKKDACILGRGSCEERNLCPLHVRWIPLRKAIEDFLQDTTLADLLSRTDTQQGYAALPLLSAPKTLTERHRSQERKRL